ncbi:hypothetical protein NP493_524g01017 [Ridgeia piscesae]|uniref:Protein PTHB1 n=1 Tax=Ridgeia piscesae TaxID=27915 RepID=A0AAD9KXY9_RIDPI|nr:hypothetical protein NP493_524g01017 [Ridgeia piscesae]
MSLFKAREWWSTKAGVDEEFDTGCLCVGDIDNRGTGDKIIIGSYHGYLRIYEPHPTKTEDGWTGFQAQDVLCEMQLPLPILQVEAGLFVSGSDSVHLAILHPRKLSVYSLLASSGAVSYGAHYQLKLVYEHNLQRTAFNFCYGPFGGVKGRDFLCVQSMDGTLTVFEQESFSFTRFLPGALLPGPVTYIARTDSFVTVSSSRQVECYKYQVLAVASETKTKEESQNIKTGKRVAVDWTFGLGEEAIQIMMTTFPQTPPSIYILGERNIFVLTEGGKLRMMQKFEFSPSCFLPYTSVSEGSINCLVATHSSSLMVYSDMTLKWAAQLSNIPIQLKVARINNLDGVIVTLDEHGQLSCCYLGTDPAMFTVPSSEVREIDYKKLDQEMKHLQEIIKKDANKYSVMPSLSKSDDDISIHVSVPFNLDEHSRAAEVEIEEEDPIPSITVKIQLKCKIHVNNVRVNINVELPLVASTNTIKFSSLEPGHPGEAMVVFYMKHTMLPTDLKGWATVVYENTTGAPRVLQADIRLPIRLVVKPCFPVKNANFRITIDTNKPPVNLNDLFPDLLGENAGGAGNALGFRYYGLAPVITVLASKTSQRYRLQSDEFEFMWLVLNELVTRLSSYFASHKQVDFKVSYTGDLPLQEYFVIIERHFECRLTDDNLYKLLADRAAQFRAIQRRLLTRFKDKTPAPLINLDTLIDGTYRQLIAMGDAVEQNTQVKHQMAVRLSAATRLLNLLIRLWQDMSEEEAAVLEATLTPDITESISKGWEETVDASITHLLRTSLSKSAKDQTVNPSPLTLLKDTSKLKKHITLLCDRLGRGAHLVPEGSAGEAARHGETARKAKSAIDSTHTDLGVPLGSKFGEKKNRHRHEGGDLGALRVPTDNKLPPLGGSTGDMEIRKHHTRKDIPDLDELGTDSQRHLVNGSELAGM